MSLEAGIAAITDVAASLLVAVAFGGSSGWGGRSTRYEKARARRA